jgi:copper(I)-binding protein
MIKYFTLALCLSSAISTALAAGVSDNIEISGGYVRAVPESQPISAAFMQIDNQDFALHAVVSASSSFAKTVELHTHTQEDGMMKMRQIPKIDLPAGGSALLQPGGLHIMLIGLTKPLSAEAQVDLKLSFEDGSEKEMSLPVKSMTMMH